MGLITGALVSTTFNQMVPLSGATVVAATGGSLAAAGTSWGQKLFSERDSDELLSGERNDAFTGNAWDQLVHERAGNPTVPVKYDVEFRDVSGHVNTGKPGNSQAKFRFTLQPGTSLPDGPSDSRVTVDKTLSVVLVRVSDDAPMATHFYGTKSGVLLNVLINTTDPLNPFYETHFKRTDLIDPNTGVAPVGSASYVLNVYVRDVDGKWMPQATSSSVTF
jgi:hypothetical protein